MDYGVFSTDDINISGLRVQEFEEATLSRESVDKLYSYGNVFFQTGMHIFHFDCFDIYYHSEKEDQEVTQLIIENMQDSEINKYNHFVFRNDIPEKHPELYNNIVWGIDIYSAKDIDKVNRIIKSHPKAKFEFLVIMNKLMINELARIQNFARDKFTVYNLSEKGIIYNKIKII